MCNFFMYLSHLRYLNGLLTEAPEKIVNWSKAKTTHKLLRKYTELFMERRTKLKRNKKILNKMKKNPKKEKITKGFFRMCWPKSLLKTIPAKNRYNQLSVLQGTPNSLANCEICDFLLTLLLNLVVNAALLFRFDLRHLG